jgi:hypothetical protein
MRRKVGSTLVLLYKNLSSASEWEVGLANELIDFFDAIPKPAEDLLREIQLDRELVKFNVRSRITEPHYRRLVRGIAAYGVSAIRTHLVDLKYLDE